MANDTTLGGLFQGNRKPTQFRRIFQPDPAWLAKAAPEPILEPDLPVVDTHHHIRDFPRYRYLLDEFLAHAASHPGVWFYRAIDLARFWLDHEQS